MEVEPLWPEEFRSVDADTLFRFVTENCWTYNEANSAVELIPAHDYVGLMAEAWLECRAAGRPMIVEKSRRLIMSWLFRSFELWLLGLAPAKGVICGLNYPKAAEHVWRIWWLYKELSNRRPKYALPGIQTLGGNTGSQAVDKVLLANGSMVEALNQDGASFQGSGYSFVTMEEASLFKNPGYMWGQALRVTEGKPGTIGGHVTVITNASPNKAWHEIKA